jgi:hypothetical protein
MPNNGYELDEVVLVSAHANISLSVDLSEFYTAQ